MPQFLDHEALTEGDPNFASVIAGNPIGTIIQSVLTVAQLNGFQADTWQICDGSAILADSKLLTLDPLGTGNVPDIRGRYLADAGGSTIDSAYTDKVLNGSLDDNFQSHRHTLSLQGYQQDFGRRNSPGWQYEPINAGSATSTDNDDTYGSGTIVTEPAVGSTSQAIGSGMSTVGGEARFGAETRPLTYVINTFVKVN